MQQKTCVGQPVPKKGVGDAFSDIVMEYMEWKADQFMHRRHHLQDRAQWAWQVSMTRRISGDDDDGGGHRKSMWVLPCLCMQGQQRFPALIIVPCMQLCWTLFGVISGLLYFKEYVGMSGLQVAMFVLGVVVVCMGAGTLAHASQGDMAGLHPADSELDEQEWTAAGKAAHAHAAAPVTELQVAQDSADFKLQVVWSGTDSDQVLVAHCECPEITTG